MPDEPQGFTRGMKEGQTDALLTQHTEHLKRINGSIEEFIKVTKDLASCMRELASEIRTLQEGGRLAEERVRVAADVLATETERRREELAVTAVATESTQRTADRSFSKRERLAGLAVAVVAGVVSVYFGTR